MVDHGPDRPERNAPASCSGVGEERGLSPTKPDRAATWRPRIRLLYEVVSDNLVKSYEGDQLKEAAWRLVGGPLLFPSFSPDPSIFHLEILTVHFYKTLLFVVSLRMTHFLVYYICSIYLLEFIIADLTILGYTFLYTHSRCFVTYLTI